MSDDVKDGGNVQTDFGINVGNISNAKAIISASGLALTDIRKVDVRELEITVPNPWINVSAFSNGWSNFNSPNNLVKYMKHPDGRVEMRGWMGGGTLNLAAFTLPAQYAPAEQIYLACGDSSSSHFAALSVDAAGVVMPIHGSNPFFNVSFSAADSRPAPLSCFPAYLKTDISDPIGIFVLGTEYAEYTRTPNVKPGAAVNHCDWDFVKKFGGNYIKINNLTGLPYSQKTRVRFMIVGE